MAGHWALQGAAGSVALSDVLWADPRVALRAAKSVVCWDGQLAVAKAAE